jgi:DNA polymerase-3 subunit delta
LRIGPDQLAQRLAKDLPAVLLLHGAEPLMIEESCDVIRRAALERGFGERISMTVGPRFEWDQIREHSQSLSLFSSRTLLELRLPSGRPGEPGARAITEFCDHPPPDTVLLVIAGRLEGRVKQSRWVKALQKCGAVVEHPALESDRLPHWIRARLKSRGLNADDQAVKLLSYYLEGNLLAAAQEIDKLALLCADGRLTADRVISSIGDHARFTVYTLVDACLSGNVPKALRMLNSLRAEGTEPVLINWALSREIRNLARVSAGLARGEPRAKLFRDYNIWARRTHIVTAALKRLDIAGWWALLQAASRADRVAKGQAEGDVWLVLERICLTLGGVSSAVAESSG